MIKRPWQVREFCKRGHRREALNKPCRLCQKLRMQEIKRDPEARKAFLEKRRAQWENRYYGSRAYREKSSRQCVAYQKRPIEPDAGKARSVAARLLAKADLLAKQELMGLIRVASL